MDTKGGQLGSGWRGNGGGGMNWEIEIDIYTLICIKWITNKNLLYKKINKIKFKREYDPKKLIYNPSISLFVQLYIQLYSNSFYSVIK